MSATEPVIDAEVLDEPGTELAPVAPAPALFKTDDPVEVVEKATRVANALKDVIDSRGLTQKIQGKAFVKVEGWTLLGSMLGVTAVCTGTEALPDGFRATVEARMPDGRIVGSADALCTRKERTWKDRDDYALLSMAQTRATSKALRIPLGFVVTLAGYSATPAEEMPQPTPAATGKATGSRLLTEEERARTVAAIEESGEKVQLVLTAVGVDATDDLTVAHAKQIKALISHD